MAANCTANTAAKPQNKSVFSQPWATLIPDLSTCILSLQTAVSKSTAHRRRAMRVTLAPIPIHFSRCGAKRAAARLRWQLGQTHSYCFLVDSTWPNTSRPRTFTISVPKAEQQHLTLNTESPLISRPGNEAVLL